MKPLSKIFKKRKGDIWVLSAKWTAPVFQLVGGLVTARYLLPEEMGVIQSVMLIMTYAKFLQFGVFNGLNRNLPMYLAKGQTDKAQGYINASFKTARWVGFASSLIALFASFLFYRNSENPLYWQVSLFVIPGIYFSKQRLHLDTVYRGTRSFERYGKGLFLQNFIGLICSGLTAFFGVYIAAFKTAMSAVFGYFYLKRNQPIKSYASATFSDIKELAIVGLPMMVSGQIYSWLSVADRTIIATRLTAEDLGHFALATIVMSSLSVFPTTMNMLLYPRVAHAYGANGTSRVLRRYIWIGLAVNLALLIPVAIIGWFALPPLVHSLLPRYADGIPAARIILIGSVFKAYSGPSVIIPILRKNLPSQIAGVFSIALVWGFGLWAIQQGYGIEGVAWARVAATAFYALFIIGYVFYLTGKDIPCEA